MTDEELRRILRELDSAAELTKLRQSDGFAESDAKVQSELSEIRHELAVYRAVLQPRSHRVP